MQQFQASKTEIPTLLLPIAVDRGCTKNSREPGKREREAEAEGDPARGRFWEEGTPARDWEWHAYPSFQPMVSPYLEGLCQSIQAGKRGGSVEGSSLFWLLKGHLPAKLVVSF